METSRLAVPRAAERDTLYSLYCPDGRRVTAASVVVCVASMTSRAPSASASSPPPWSRSSSPSARSSARILPSRSRASTSVSGPGRAQAETRHGPRGSARQSLAWRTRSGPRGSRRPSPAWRLGSGSRPPSGSGRRRCSRRWRRPERGRIIGRAGPGAGTRTGACLSIACRNGGSPRSLRELALATATRKEEIVKMTALIRRRLGVEEAGQGTGVGVVRASGHMRHFCQLVGLGDREAAAATEAVRRLEESDLEVPHIGESVAAAVVCMALERAYADRPEVDVSAATGVSTVTINNVCMKLRPHAKLLFG